MRGRPLGDSERAEEAIIRATRAREAVRGDELDELGGIMAFPLPRQLYYVADTRVGDAAGNAWRVGYDGSSVYPKVVKALELCGKRGRRVGVIAAVTPSVLGRDRRSRAWHAHRRARRSRRRIATEAGKDSGTLLVTRFRRSVPY